jgi:predicted nucleic acid-binding protein
VNQFYCDASALAKRYAPEVGSELMDHLFDHAGRDRLMCLLLGASEVVSLLVRKRNRGDLSRPNFIQSFINLHDEVINALDFETLEATNVLILASVPLIVKHSINSNDAVVLQSALDTAAALRSASDDLVFIAADQRLVRAAQAEGLTTFNPETDTQADLDALLAA